MALTIIAIFCPFDLYFKRSSEFNVSLKRNEFVRLQDQAIRDGVMRLKIVSPGYGPETKWFLLIAIPF